MSTSASPRLRSQSVLTTSRDVRLSIVPTPAPRRGFVMTAVICAAILLGAFIALFFLNASMIETAFEIQDVQKETNLAYSTEATLEDEILRLSSPNELSARAKELGLTPATGIRHIDLATKTILEAQ